MINHAAQSRCEKRDHQGCYDREDGILRNYVAGRNTPLTEFVVEKLPVMLHGTGVLCSAPV